MEQYIPKSALVADIEKIRAKWFGINNDFADGQKGALTDVLSLIDTLEVKEVDLEEDINDFINEEYHYEEYEGKWVDEKDWRDSIQRCAKHFFTLGLKAQKGEEV